MNGEVLLVLGILAGTIVLFTRSWFRLDVTALLALLALSLTGILSPAQALAGFSDPVVMMIAGLFVVGDGLFQTGVARAMGRLPARLAGESEVRLLVVIMLMVALLSGFMSSTGTVAVMLPVVVGLAWERGIRPSRLLIPLSVASLLGGMLTLIGTAPNIVVSNQLASGGREPFGFFTFLPVGLAMVAVGVTFMALVGRRFLPDRAAPGGAGGREDGPTLGEMADSYRLATLRVRVGPDSPLAGRSLRELHLPERSGVTVLAREEPATLSLVDRLPRPPRIPRVPGRRRRKREGPGSDAQGRLEEVGPDTLLLPGTILQIQAPAGSAPDFLREGGLLLLPDEAGAVAGGEMGMAEVLLTPRSRLLDHTLKELKFRERYRVTALAVKRGGQPIPDDPRETVLHFGDTILVKGPWDAIRLLEREHRDFVVVAEPREMDDALRPLHRAPVAVGIMVIMMLLMTFSVVPPVTAVLLAAAAMVVLRCITVEDAYRSINWESVVLIAAILPMATALEVTGALALIVEGLDSLVGGAGPLLLLGSLFLLTSSLSQVISNTATTVLLAPIGFQVAVNAGLNPEPFLMGIAVAASTAFATPMASPVNTLVLGPGGYRFGDFFRVGILLQGLILVTTLLLVPLLFPF